MSNRGQIFTEPSLTQQKFKHQTDVNSIMRKVRKGAVLPPPSELIVGDFSDVADLHTILERTNKVKDAFMRLPPETRNQFRNDPQRFIKYMSDPEKTEEQIKLGLRVKPEEIKEPEPEKVIIVEDPKKSAKDD